MLRANDANIDAPALLSQLRRRSLRLLDDPILRVLCDAAERETGRSSTAIDVLRNGLPACSNGTIETAGPVDVRIGAAVVPLELTTHSCTWDLHRGLGVHSDSWMAATQVHHGSPVVFTWFDELGNVTMTAPTPLTPNSSFAVLTNLDLDGDGLLELFAVDGTETEQRLYLFEHGQDGALRLESSGVDPRRANPSHWTSFGRAGGRPSHQSVWSLRSGLPQVEHNAALIHLQRGSLEYQSFSAPLTNVSSAVFGYESTQVRFGSSEAEWLVHVPVQRPDFSFHEVIKRLKMDPEGNLIVVGSFSVETDDRYYCRKFLRSWPTAEGVTDVAFHCASHSSDVYLYTVVGQLDAAGFHERSVLALHAFPAAELMSPLPEQCDGDSTAILLGIPSRSDGFESRNLEHNQLDLWVLQANRAPTLVDSVPMAHDRLRRSVIQRRSDGREQLVIIMADRQRTVLYGYETVVLNGAATLRRLWSRTHPFVVQAVGVTDAL